MFIIYSVIQCLSNSLNQGLSGSAAQWLSSSYSLLYFYISDYDLLALAPSNPFSILEENVVIFPKKV